MRDHYLNCCCSCSDHVIRISWFEDEIDGVYIHVQLPKVNFFKRLWLGIKYILGFSSPYGHWDETLLLEPDLKKLKVLIDDALARFEKERKII